MPLIKSANVPTSMVPFSMNNIENQAKTILARARQKADQLLGAAQTECEILKSTATAQGLADGKKQGLASGLEEGKKTGHAQALAEHREKLTALITALTRTAAQLEASRGELESHGLKSVIELAAAIARRVTKRQAIVEPAALIANLQGAMKLVCHWADVRIAVRPEQMAVLRAEMPELKVSWPQLNHVELIEDATLAAGGCRIFTAGGCVDGDLEAQLDRVIAQVLPTGE